MHEILYCACIVCADATERMQAGKGMDSRAGPGGAGLVPLAQLPLAVLSRVVKAGLAAKVTFGQRPEVDGELL